MSKLTTEQKIEIFKKSKKALSAALAKEYKVNKQMISNLINLKNKKGLNAFDKVKKLKIF
ncbi:hypothetical protein ACW95P_00850 [Candidatus Mycoplasma pogonae]